MSDNLPRIKNLNVSVSEENGNVAFLRRIVPGGADKSYGIHVAQLAGMPNAVVNRAWEVLRTLEAPASKDSAGRGKADRHRGAAHPTQLSLIPNSSPALDELKELDVASMTPIEAINKLYELQERAKERPS